MDEKSETTTTTATPTQTLKFYKKELISNRLALPNGRAVKFDQVGDSDTGTLATADSGLIGELEKAVAAGRGGVTEITEAQFQDLKKNPPAGRSQIRSLNAQSLQQLLKNQKAASVPVAEVKQEPSAPMEVPKGLVTMSSRRKLKEMTEAKSQPPQAAAA